MRNKELRLTIPKVRPRYYSEEELNNYSETNSWNSKHQLSNSQSDTRTVSQPTPLKSCLRKTVFSWVRLNLRSNGSFRKMKIKKCHLLTASLHQPNVSSSILTMRSQENTDLILQAEKVQMPMMWKTLLCLLLTRKIKKSSNRAQQNLCHISWSERTV